MNPRSGALQPRKRMAAAELAALSNRAEDCPARSLHTQTVLAETPATFGCVAAAAPDRLGTPIPPSRRERSSRTGCSLLDAAARAAASWRHDCGKVDGERIRTVSASARASITLIEAPLRGGNGVASPDNFGRADMSRKRAGFRRGLFECARIGRGIFPSDRSRPRVPQPPPVFGTGGDRNACFTAYRRSHAGGRGCLLASAASPVTGSATPFPTRPIAVQPRARIPR